MVPSLQKEREKKKKKTAAGASTGSEKLQIVKKLEQLMGSCFHPAFIQYTVILHVNRDNEMHAPVCIHGAAACFLCFILDLGNERARQKAQCVTTRSPFIPFFTSPTLCLL